MSVIEKIISFIKSFLCKKEQPKTIEAPKIDITKETRNEFLESIKVNIPVKMKKKKIETLVCVGDGLGIQNKLNS